MEKPITNNQRAKWALEALRAHYSVREGDASIEETLEGKEEILIDLLADLMHFAVKNKVSFSEAFRIAKGHFDEEVAHPGRW